MLIIYGALTIGGVETFFLRIARERFKKGLVTKFLLQNPGKSNLELLNQVSQYATIYSYDDISKSPKLLKWFKASGSIRSSFAIDLFEGVEQIHTFKGEDALIGYKLLESVNISIPISVGFYHYMHYLWGWGNTPYFESVNRRFVLEYLPKELLMLFSRDSVELYSSYTKSDFSQSNTFSIGVIESAVEYKPISVKPKVMKICAVGRLVAFKTYNLTLLKVVKELKESGVLVILDIYGSGPLKGEMLQSIQGLDLQEIVTLKGSFDYSRFAEIVSEYDLFIGTGTAIVESSALAIPSLAAIDHDLDAECYGFFPEIYDRQYGRDNIDVNRESFYTEIKRFAQMDIHDVNRLRLSHVNCVERFTISNSVIEIDKLTSVSMPQHKFMIFNSIRYDLSRLLHHIRLKVDKKYIKLRLELPKLPL
jgi:hypothetical protein